LPRQTRNTPRVRCSCAFHGLGAQPSAPPPLPPLPPPSAQCTFTNDTMLTGAAALSTLETRFLDQEARHLTRTSSCC
jgi:hypothetical protein